MINAKVGRVTPGIFLPNAKEVQRQKENNAIYGSAYFLDACEKAEITPTKRQAVKFKLHKGIAYKMK